MNVLEIITESKTTLLERHLKQQNLLVESVCKDLLVEQQIVVKNIVKELQPLIEASLTADQITQLFTNVEQGATAAGGNRNILGKTKDIAGAGVDAVKKANEIIGKVGKWVADTTPVKMADQKFEQLKAKVGAKFPDLDKQLTGLGTWMKDNPGKSAAIIGVMTALASLAGGPVGGAIAGQVIRGAAELIKGEKLSTAVGRGIKTAVLGYLSGALADKVGSWLSGLRAEAVPFDDGLTQISFNGSSTISSPGYEWTRKFDLKNMVVMPDDKETVLRLIKDVNAGKPGAFDSLYSLAKEVSSSDYKASMAGISDAAKEWAVQNDAAFKALEMARKAITAVAQGAVAASTGGKSKKESVDLSTRQIKGLFDWCDGSPSTIIMEGPLDAIKNKAATIGKNLTTKITADKLTSAWKKAGSPTDSAAVADILRNAGVSDEVLAPAFKSMKIKLPKPGTAPAAKDQPTDTTATDKAKKAAPAEPAKLDYKAIQAAVAQLRTRDAQSLLKHIDSIDGAPAAQKSAAPAQQATPAAPPAAQPKVKVKGAKAPAAAPAARPATPPVSV